MAIVLKCDCGKTLKIAESSAGKRVRCPGCSTILVVPAADADDNAVLERPIPKAAVAAGPSRRRPRHADDDEEDDRPRDRRRPIRDDDDEDDRPRKRKSTGNGNKVLLISLLGGGGGLLLLAVLALAFIPYFMGSGFFFLGGGSSGSSSAAGASSSGDGGTGVFVAELKYLPDGCQSIDSERSAKMRATAFYKDVASDMSDANRKNESEYADKLGIALDDIERKTKALTRDGQVTIITTSKPLSAADIAGKGSARYKETKVGNYTIYEPGMGRPGDRGSGFPGRGSGPPGFPPPMGSAAAFAVPEAKIYIEGPPRLIQAILSRDKTAPLSDGLRKSMSLVDFSGFAAKATDRTAPGIPNAIGSPDSKDVEAEGEQGDISANAMTSTTTYLCKSEEAAASYKIMVDQWAKQLEALIQGLTGTPLKATITQNGNKVIVTVSMTASDLKAMMKKGMNPFK